MTQAAQNTNANLMASSTPIRIGSGSFHGVHGSSSGSHQGSSGTEPTLALSQQQSSSVPTAVGQLQSQTSVATGSSQQSLAVQTSGTPLPGPSTSATPPNSAGLRQAGGFANWGSDSRDKYDGNQTNKASIDTSKLNRKESYKAQRKNYRREKKRVASELMNSLADPAVIVLADWLKVRGTLKSWTKLWCVLKPGILLLYKSPKTKSSQWVGTILLTSCQVIERPSKKDGFCFKLFHPLEQSIWAPRGPDKETIGAVVQPLPTAYLIFRAPSQAAGKCWMDALELSLRCSALLLRSNNNSTPVQGMDTVDSAQISHETQWSEADYEKHFNEHGLCKRNFLAVPDTDRSMCSSDTSLPSRSQTPIFQQLYTTMTNWERVLANTPEFQKIKLLSKLRKFKSGRKDLDSSVGDFSDVSSVDFSPQFTNKTSSHQSLPKKKRQFIKTNSLHSVFGDRSSTSDDEEGDFDSIVTTRIRSSSPRPVSAPPIIVEPFAGNLKDLGADSQNEREVALASGVDTDSDSDVENTTKDVEETPYVHLPEEEFGDSGEQVEELGEENKSLIWCLVKQVRPGMDLSKVVLPTFILEPRSFLDKLSDSYFHADILSRAVAEEDPFTRMKIVVHWYLTGFYKKPKGLKKPYNPILGETFRCYWQHPSGSRTFYISEQVSHHPPISAFYVTNREDGFCISCSILAKSKFYGNSTSAVLEGVAVLRLLPRGESYTLSSPYAHCKGILMGTLSMELGGKINIECEKTGYRSEIEFKLKPFLGGSESTNVVAGKIKLGKETLATLSGRWDSEMRIKDTKTGEETTLFTIDREMKQKRLHRYVVPLEAQLPTESERLWYLVSAAIRNDDQAAATKEKTVLEEDQRVATKARAAENREWVPKHFEVDLSAQQWIYKYADVRPWDPRNDVKQYEANYKVLTKTRHKAPLVRTGSMMSVFSMTSTNKMGRKSKRSIKARQSGELSLSGTSDTDGDEFLKRAISNKSTKKLLVALDQVQKALDQHTQQLSVIQNKIDRMQYAQPSLYSGSSSSVFSTIPVVNRIPASISHSTALKFVVFAFVVVLLSICIKWFLK